jgi:hypothetical protein
MSDDFFAPPPFNAEDALATLTRQLRETKLTARAGSYEWSGRPVVRVALEGTGTIRAQIVKRPAGSPEWETRLLCSHADLRKFTDELRRRLARWSEHPDD